MVAKQDKANAEALAAAAVPAEVIPRQFPAGLLSKLAKVQKELSSVPKNGWNPHFQYAYATEADVVEAVKASFDTHGLIYQVSVEDVQIIMNGQKPLTQVRCKFTIMDSQSGEAAWSFFYGHGEDKGDKGIYKAITGAQKYFFMKTFMVATNDDPEQSAGTNATAPAQEAAPAATTAPAAAATPAAPAAEAAAKPKKPSSFARPKPDNGAGATVANGSTEESWT